MYLTLEAHLTIFLGDASTLIFCLRCPRVFEEEESTSRESPMILPSQLTLEIGKNHAFRSFVPKINKSVVPMFVS